MTFAVGYVVGGTGAGRKKPLKPKPYGWMCDCPDFVVHPGYMTRCLDCGTRRPKETK